MEQNTCQDDPENRRRTITQEIPFLTLSKMSLSRKPNAERYDRSINRQGTNSSKGKQLCKIKDKVGYCTNNIS